MLASPDVVSAYYGQVDGAQDSESVGGYIYPCSSTLPTLSIAVGDDNLATVPTSVLNYSSIGTDKATGESCKFYFSRSIVRTNGFSLLTLT
jgi:aspergillopepsin I